MAERRMFAKSVVLADAFLDMPNTAKILYFMMGMAADDDGFINNPRSLMRQVGAKKKDLELLERMGYVYVFSSGVAVLRHWKMQNYIAPTRYKPTNCQLESELLDVDRQKVYVMRDTAEKGSDKCRTNVEQMSNNCRTNVEHLSYQDRIGKDRAGKGREAQGAQACAQVIEAYNRICVSLPKCSGLTKGRELLIRKAMERGMGLGELEQLFEKAQKSSFLQGKGASGFTAGIDWLLGEENCVKVLEGNYDDRAAGPKGAVGGMGNPEMTALEDLMG